MFWPWFKGLHIKFEFLLRTQDVKKVLEYNESDLLSSESPYSTLSVRSYSPSHFTFLGETNQRKKGILFSGPQR